jgi:flagellar hook-basal body complex protein FliE
MIVPAVGGLAGALSQGLTSGVSLPTTNPATPHSQSSPGLGGIGGVNGTEGTGGLEGPAGNGPGSFSSQLSGAISSLEQTQQSAAGAAQSLATGTATDPESAVVTVEDASLEMQLAAQIRTKATEAAQSIFQTQV